MNIAAKNDEAARVRNFRGCPKAVKLWGDKSRDVPAIHCVIDFLDNIGRVVAAHAGSVSARIPAVIMGENDNAANCN